MANLRDVARQANVSSAVVSAVLRGGSGTIRVSQATRERVLRAAKMLRYSPNAAARSLKTGKSNALGLLFPYSRGFLGDDPFSVRCMTGILSETILHGYNLMLHTGAVTDWHQYDETKLWNQQIDGLIFVVPPPESFLVDQCRDRNVPCVTIVDDPGREGVCVVNADEFEGGRIATQHLIDLGHRRIAHLAGYDQVASSAARSAGYQAALIANGIEIDPVLIIPAGFEEYEGEEAARKLLALSPAQRPTAIFAANDGCARGAMDVLLAAGVRIPEDIAIVGYDDSPMAALLSPPLTTVRLPVEEMGKVAVQLLVEQAEQGSVCVDTQPPRILSVHLVIRQSCGAKPIAG